MNTRTRNTATLALGMVAMLGAYGVLPVSGAVATGIAREDYKDARRALPLQPLTNHPNNPNRAARRKKK